MDLVGIPRLCFMLDGRWLEAEETQPPLDNATIVIPHIHPGNQRYGARSITLHRILDFCWTITLIICEHAARKYQKMWNTQNFSRAEIIEAIWEIINP